MSYRKQQVAELLQVRDQLESSYRDTKARLNELVEELSSLKQRAKDCLRRYDREGAKRHLYRMHSVREQVNLVMLVIKKQQSFISEIDAKLSHIQS